MARAYAAILTELTGTKPGARAAATRRRRATASRGSPRATTAGWSRCAWCRRASTCRGCRSASTPPARRRRCSSRRRSAASCAPGAAASWRRSSCRACRCCSASPASSSASATTPSTASRRRRPARRLAARTGRAARRRRPPTCSTSTSGRRSARSPPSRRCSTRARSSARSPSPAAPEEWDFIGLPGILEPEEVSRLLRSRQARQRRHAAERPPAPDGDASPQALHRTLSEQRKLLNGLVSIHARRPGTTHAQVHAEVRRTCGGPEVVARDRGAAAGAHRPAATPDRLALAG